MKYTNVICPRCQAGIDVTCNRPGGRACNTHSQRIAASMAHVESIVPAITRPVMALKEKFTLAGEPLAISTCMKALGLELDKQDGNHFCFWPAHEDTQFVVIYSGDHWESAAYRVDAEDFKTSLTTEADVLIALIKRYYHVMVKKELNPDVQVIASLSARLLPLANQVQLDTLRSDIKRMCPVK